MNNINQKIGSMIRQRRIEVKLSQSELGKAIGHSHATISDMERGIRSVTISDIVLIAEKLLVEPTYFLMGAKVGKYTLTITNGNRVVRTIDL